MFCDHVLNSNDKSVLLTMDITRRNFVLSLLGLSGFRAVNYDFNSFVNAQFQFHS